MNKHKNRIVFIGMTVLHRSCEDLKILEPFPDKVMLREVW